MWASPAPGSKQHSAASSFPQYSPLPSRLFCSRVPLVRHHPLNRTPRHSRGGIERLRPACQIKPPGVFVKFHWNLATTIPLVSTGKFRIPTAELSNCDRDCMSHKAYNIYHMAFTEKFANPCPRRWISSKIIGQISKKFCWPCSRQ